MCTCLTVVRNYRKNLSMVYYVALSLILKITYFDFIPNLVQNQSGIPYN